MDRTVILAADRRARCAVEVPAKPEPAEKTAGEELAHYIGKLAGAPIGLHHGEKSCAPVRILVGARASVEIGDLPLNEVRDDGYVLCVKPGRIALAGANARGTLYAAYELIDRLMGARRTAESYHRTRDQAHLKRLVRERDAIVDYITANPVEGAYHLGGIGGQRGNINNFLLGHLWGVDKI